jgi:cell division protein FtsW
MDSLSSIQRLHIWIARMLALIAGRMLGGASAGGQALPVNLGDYGMNSRSRGNAARMQSVDQALLWVVGALLLWGMVMVYSASIAIPDNPKFSGY